jgi:hypothetical protein
MQQSQSHGQTCRRRNQIVTEPACIRKRRLLTLFSSRLDEAMGKQLPFSDIAVIQQKGDMVWPLQASVATRGTVNIHAIYSTNTAAVCSGKIRMTIWLEVIEVARSPGSLIPD